MFPRHRSFRKKWREAGRARGPGRVSATWSQGPGSAVERALGGRAVEVGAEKVRESELCVLHARGEDIRREIQALELGG